LKQVLGLVAVRALLQRRRIAGVDVGAGAGGAARGAILAVARLPLERRDGSWQHGESLGLPRRAAAVRAAVVLAGAGDNVRRSS